jgi:predicted  nucleic acid-binding Zn-ribbon protein
MFDKEALEAELESRQQAKKEIMSQIEARDVALAHIKAQRARAQALVTTEGEYSNPDWWGRLHAAKGHIGRERTALSAQLGEVNREIKRLTHQPSNNNDEQRFIAVARRCWLPRTTTRYGHGCGRGRG